MSAKPLEHFLCLSEELPRHLGRLTTDEITELKSG